MLSNFLKESYKNKVVSRKMLENNLKKWTIGTDSLNRTFKFYSFKQAMTFLSLSKNYAEKYDIKTQMYNYPNFNAGRMFTIQLQ